MLTQAVCRGAPHNSTLDAMTADERKRLVQGFIDHHAKRFVWGPDNVLRQQDQHFWAWEQLDEAVRNEPELAWSLILDVLAATEDEFTLSCLAAGPLEDLLRHHGPTFIDRIEQQAQRDVGLGNSFAAFGGVRHRRFGRV